MSDTIFGKSIATGGSLYGRQDEFICERVIGGPNSGKDIRMFISLEAAEAIVAVASRSTSLRAAMRNCAIRITDWRDADGHPYQVVTIMGGSPFPELVDHITASQNTKLLARDGFHNFREIE